MSQDDFQRGLATRTQVMGQAFVDKAFANLDGFSRPLQEFLTEHAWGSTWQREGIELKTRSLVTVGMLQGQRQGEAAALTRVLRRRFGELSATDQARIAQAELAELECWLDRALDASTLAAVFAADDQPAA